MIGRVFCFITDTLRASLSGSFLQKDAVNQCLVFVLWTVAVQSFMWGGELDVNRLIITRLLRI